MNFVRSTEMKINLNPEDAEMLSSKEVIRKIIQENPDTVMAFDIFDDDILIGFVLVHRFEERKYFLWEYAIGMEFQNLHKGTAALREFIRYMKHEYDAALITTTYIYGNDKAKHVYEKVGFAETDVVDEPDCHEVNMELDTMRFIMDENYICKDQDGNILVSIENMSEEELSADPLFTHCLAVVKVGDEYLLGRNKWRKRYEIFGGCREKGESARECISRECYEELGFKSQKITYIGAMRLLLKPDYFSKEEREELGGLYGISLPDVSLDDLYGGIKDKEEITELAFYSRIKDKEMIALIDEKLMEYYS